MDEKLVGYFPFNIKIRKTLTIVFFNSNNVKKEAYCFMVCILWNFKLNKSQLYKVAIELFKQVIKLKTCYSAK